MLRQSRASPALRHPSIRAAEEKRKSLWGRLRSGLRLTTHKTRHFVHKEPGPDLSKVTLNVAIQGDPGYRVWPGSGPRFCDSRIPAHDHTHMLKHVASPHVVFESYPTISHRRVSKFPTSVPSNYETTRLWENFSKYLSFVDFQFYPISHVVM